MSGAGVAEEETMGAAGAEPVESDFVSLARHHRECEGIAEEMAMLLDHVRQGHKPPDMSLRITHVLARWEAHQWPSL